MHYDTIDQTQKGTGYKEFLRWQHNNESRYAPDGNRNLVPADFAEQEYINFMARYGRTTRSFHQAKWRDMNNGNIGTVTGRLRFIQTLHKMYCL